MFNLFVGFVLIWCAIHNDMNRGEDGKALSTVLIFMAILNICIGVF